MTIKNLNKILILFAGVTLFSSPAIAKPIAPGNMPAYCRGEASSQFATKPMYIKTQKLVRNKNGSYYVKGTGDLGNQGKKPFQCDFSKKGEFLHFRSLVDEGKL
jgi:hypothetical protein